MSRILKLVLMTSVTFLASITVGLTPVFAVDPLAPACSDSTAATTEFCQNAEEENTNRTFVFGQNTLFMKIVQVIVWLTGAISVVMIIIGGVRYTLSAGDSNATKGAKDTILYALVGLLVAVFAQFIISFVLSQFK